MFIIGGLLWVVVCIVWSSCGMFVVVLVISCVGVCSIRVGVVVMLYSCWVGVLLWLM